jgi:hypothetical protein
MKQTEKSKTARLIRTLPGAPKVDPRKRPILQNNLTTLYRTKDGYPTYGDDFRKDWNEAADEDFRGWLKQTTQSKS